MVGNLWVQLSTQLAFKLNSNQNRSDQDWLPLVSLRHVAQQIMVRNLADSSVRVGFDPHRVSISSSSTGSCDSFPTTPLWGEEEPLLVKAGSPSDAPFRPNTVCIPSRQHTASFPDHLTIKPTIDSSLKAAKVLGIEALSGPQKATKPLTSSLHLPSYAMPSLRDLVDTKLRKFRRPSSQRGLSLKSVTKGNCAQLMDFVEMQRRTVNKGGFRLMATPSTDSKISTPPRSPTMRSNSPSTIVCVSDSFADQQYVLEVLDDSCIWYLRFHDKSSLVLWLSGVKDAQTKLNPPTSPLPIPSTRSHQFNRHTAPATTFRSPLNQILEYVPN
ncbi:hypothetical protein L0F63_007466 [Massospora cicadina]|nr:hypothetical protein L0F63_007466 [Massospora cicadina]